MSLSRAQHSEDVSSGLACIPLSCARSLSVSLCAFLLLFLIECLTVHSSPSCQVFVAARYLYGANRLVIQQSKRGLQRAVPASLLCCAMDPNTLSMPLEAQNYQKKSRKLVLDLRKCRERDRERELILGVVGFLTGNMLQISSSIGLATALSKALVSLASQTTF